MKALVDTSVWSLALRRRKALYRKEERAVIGALAALIANGGAHLVGPIRQEILSGISDEKQYEKLRRHLRAFDDLPLTTEIWERAAQFSNRCRRAGVQGSHTDFLICAAADKYRLPIFTTDKDFVRYAKVLGLSLFDATEAIG